MGHTVLENHSCTRHLWLPAAQLTPWYLEVPPPECPLCLSGHVPFRIGELEPDRALG